ncbi:MAG: hypothetical protein P4L73_13400 [Caulobacteraceae bacterium]|nr:hypothetical protein [Caulobacteraceae bacterium]
MSLWQFQAACAGYADANSPDDDDSLTQAEFDELATMIPPEGMF